MTYQKALYGLRIGFKNLLLIRTVAFHSKINLI